nr:MAG TPA: protein of unknown function (DUF4719) [Caudoviricetes sp.]
MRQCPECPCIQPLNFVCSGLNIAIMLFLVQMFLQRPIA